MIHLAERPKTEQDCVPVSINRVGTGGSISSPLNCYEHRTHRPAIYTDKPESMSSNSPPVELLSFIRETLKLNMSDLAAVLKVSRPTVYAWLSGDEPSPENYSQIERLSGVAKEVERLKISRFEKMLKRPIFDGRSLLDKLKAQEDALQQLSALKELADKEERSRKARKGSGKTQDNAGFHELSTPIDGFS